MTLILLLAGCDFGKKYFPGPQPLPEQVLGELRMHRVSVADPFPNRYAGTRLPSVTEGKILINLGSGLLFYLPKSPFDERNNRQEFLVRFSKVNASGYELLTNVDELAVTPEDALARTLFPREHDPLMRSFVEPGVEFVSRSGLVFPVSATHLEFYQVPDFEFPDQNVQFIERIALSTFPYYRDLVLPVIQAAINPNNTGQNN